MIFQGAIRQIIRTLGRDVTYQRHSPAGTFAIRAVFERKSILVDSGQGPQASMLVPTCFILLSDLSFAPTRMDRVTVPGEGEFRVTDVSLDGQGGAELLLRVRDDES